MSSIAYVADQKMIEFHRLNGNNKLNFWRPSNSIKFADFQQGDLLFFLAKGTEKNKEKGIIGYGSFDYGVKLSPNQAWSRFGTLNGYHAKDEFFSAITKVNKKAGLPKQIGCLCLNDVVYFQEPIYPSELGHHISKRLQSYTYLDKENDSLTQKLLERARVIGVDMWSLSVNEASSDESIIELDQVKDVLNNAYDFLENGFYTVSQLRKLRRFMKLALKQLEDKGIAFDLMKRSKVDCFRYEAGDITILLPLLFLTKDTMGYVIQTLGRLFAYESYLNKSIPEGKPIYKAIVVSEPIDYFIRSIFENHNILIYQMEQDGKQEAIRTEMEKEATDKKEIEIETFDME